MRLADRYGAAVRAAHAGHRRGRLARLRATRCARSRCSSSRRPARCSWRRPIAIVAGISRAARRGIIVKGGGALETLAALAGAAVRQDRHAHRGPAAAGIASRARGDPDELLRLAASLEQVSPHVLAASIVQAARDRGPGAADARPRSTETAGAGVAGRVDGRVGRGRLGRATRAAAARCRRWARDLQRRAAIEGTTNVFVAVDGEHGRCARARRPDPARDAAGGPEPAPGRLHADRDGHRRPQRASPSMVGAAVGLDGVLADRTPADKVDAVRHERADGARSGRDGRRRHQRRAGAGRRGRRRRDGRPGRHGVVRGRRRRHHRRPARPAGRGDRSSPAAPAPSRCRASSSAWACRSWRWSWRRSGSCRRSSGALLQEAIDVAVILNALRALRGGVPPPVAVAGWTATNAQLTAAHHALEGGIAHLRTTADRWTSCHPRTRVGSSRRSTRSWTWSCCPTRSKRTGRCTRRSRPALGSDETTAALHGTHNEIFRLARLFGHLVEDLSADGPASDDWPDLRRVLYGLDAILRLHMAQEEELYGSITDPDVGTALSAA